MKVHSAMKYKHAINDLMRIVQNDAVKDSAGITWLISHTSEGRASNVIGPDLYSGIAGMALVFGEYGKLMARQDATQISFQCICHALDNAHKIPIEHRFGFYNGWTGLIYVATYLHKLHDSPTLLDKARNLFFRLMDLEPSAEFDLMAGTAGAVAGLSLISPMLGEPAIKHALRLAGVLRDTSSTWRKTGAIVWGQSNKQLPLTGFSHGNAGVGWALLELWSVAKQDWILEMAINAFKYEKLFYDGENKNWFDLRNYVSTKALKKLPPKGEVAWCHGAGGIALSRMRAYELTKDVSYLHEAMAGTDTLLQNVSLTIDSDMLPSCICHGLVGNLLMLEILNKRIAPIGKYEIPQIVDESMGDFLSHLERDSEEPSLMLGMPGLCLYLMFLNDQKIMTPVLPHAIDFL